MNIKYLLLALLLLPLGVFAQMDPHYTMFMYDKLIYNPGYAGSRDVTSANATYRDQWVGIPGAPKALSVSVDGLLGNYTNYFRKVALGLCITNQQEGVVNNTNIMAYYAYRIRMRNSVLSLGLEAGIALYNANFTELNLAPQTDPLLAHNIKNATLPNFGTGIFWYGDRFYLGASCPNLLENYYDKSASGFDNQNSKEIRSYYMSGGYTFPINDVFTFEPQFIARYAGDATYSLPFSADINASLFIHRMFMVGLTYRTSSAIDFIVHVQATKEINIGYSYDYSTSLINAFSYGTHEITVGFDFLRDKNNYTNPRFVKMF